MKIVVEQTNTGYCARSEEVAAFTTGKDMPELKANMVESINALFEANGESRVVCEADLDFVMEGEGK